MSDTISADDWRAEIDRLAVQRESAKCHKYPWSDAECEIVKYGCDKIHTRTLAAILNAANKAAGRPQRRSVKAVYLYIRVLKDEAQATPNEGSGQ